MNRRFFGNDVNVWFGTTAGAVKEQSTVTREMSTAMQQTAGNVAAINDNMTEITTAVGQVGQTVTNTRKAAQVLVR
jgi:methyl-accepting chemotaxis protein